MDDNLKPQVSSTSLLASTSPLTEKIYRDLFHLVDTDEDGVVTANDTATAISISAEEMKDIVEASGGSETADFNQVIVTQERVL